MLHKMSVGAFLLVLTTGLLAPFPGASAADDLPLVFKQTGMLDPNMKSLKGVAFGVKDRLYVAGETGVAVFGPDGKQAFQIETTGPAVGVAVGDNGEIFVAQRARVERYDAKGTLLNAWGEQGTEAGQLRYITGIAVSGSMVYVADGGARRLNRFAVDGDFVDDVRRFLIPSPYFDCEIGDDGALYLTHTGKHRVERYDANQKMLGYWGKFGMGRDRFTGCCNPTNLAVFDDGRVVTTEKGIPRLKAYDGAGTLLAYLGPDAFPEQSAGMDLAIDSKGRIALLEPVDGKIRFYELIPAKETADTDE